MSRYTLDQFVAATAQKEEARGTYELENPYTLEVDGRVWCKAGAMIGCVGGIRFTRQGLKEQGLGTLLKKMVHGRGAGADAHGRPGPRLPCRRRQAHPDPGLRAGEQVFVNGNDLLALEDGMKYEIKMMRHAAGMASGGLFNIRVSAPGSSP